MRTLVIYVLVIMPLLVSADQDAKFWLNKMSAAVESLNYEGTFVFMHDEKVETMRITHGVDYQHGIKERLVSLNGEAREVIRDEGVLTCIWPDSHFVVVEKSRARHGIPTAIPEEVEGLSDRYDLLVTGSSRIAGFDCKIIEIRPKDEYRYGYRHCIAERTGMLLKSVMLDTKGKPIERVMFTDIRFLNRIPEGQFEPGVAVQTYNWHTVAAREHVPSLRPDLAWHIGRMPPGFTIRENVKRTIAASVLPVQHMVATDGLASVSIFIAKPDAVNEFFNGAIDRGALHARALNINDHQITVVGEVPENTVQMIGESIKYKQDHD